MKWIAQIRLSVEVEGKKDPVLLERGQVLPDKVEPSLLSALRLQGLVLPVAQGPAAKEPAAAEFVASADELPAKSAKKDHWEATARLLGVSDEDLDGLDKAGVIEATTKAFEARQGRTD